MPDKTIDKTLEAIVSRYVRQVEYFKEPTDHCPFFPQHVHLEPTNACNLRCIHCHHHRDATGTRSFSRPFGMMDMGLYREVIDQIAPISSSITLDLQGEPLLHPDALEMLSYGKQRGLFTSLLTNATRVTKDLARRLLETGLDRIVFSFDGIDKAVYESVRPGARFEDVFLNILNFVRLNHEQGHRVHICMSIIRQSRTEDHIPAYRDFWASLPVDKVFVSDLLNLSGGSGVSGEIELSGKEQLPREDWPMCRVPWENIVVNWDGEVTVCPLDYNVVFSAGNVRDALLQDIWNGERFRAFRRGHLARDYSAIEANGPLCGSCNCLWDPEYDMRGFADFATRAICRQAKQFAPQLARDGAGAEGLSGDAKLKRLVQEIDKLQE